MITILLFTFSVIGLTNIINHGKIMDLLGIRPWLKRHLNTDWYESTECPECVGWWSGLVAGLALVSLSPLVFLPCAFAGSAICHCYSTVMMLIESKVEYVLSEENNEQQETP